MLGYDVSIFEIKDKNQMPWDSYKILDKENLNLFAHVDCIMLDWLNKLVEDGKATLHDGDGYPFRYSAEFGTVMETISAMIVSPHSQQWTREIKLFFYKIRGKKSDELVYLEAWDQS